MVNTQSYCLPTHLERAFQSVLNDWQAQEKSQRLWNRDPSLWTNSDEAKWMGWLTIVEEQLQQEGTFRALADDLYTQGFTDAVVLGMGGSSLCPEVLKKTFGVIPGYPELHVLDATDPAQVLSLEQRIDLSNTVFIVASKSGSTLEPNIFKQYFFERVKALKGAAKVGSRFIAITDPGSAMQDVAEADGFKQIFFGVPSIGGRYSALSSFGMVPAAVMGLDVSQLLSHATFMVDACAPQVPANENPGVLLGLLLGVLTKEGRDKITITAAPEIQGLGAWLEQLIAESTGKEGKGIIPVDQEQLSSTTCYGEDRLFVCIRLESSPDSAHDELFDKLARDGHPVIEIRIKDRYAIGQEFFRWEFATAVASSYLGINPFNQPDVEASKVATKRLTQAFEQTQTLPQEVPVLSQNDLTLFTDEKNASELKREAGEPFTVEGCMRAHLRRLQEGDYFAILAYLDMNRCNEERLQAIRHLVRDRWKVATCLGFGPRFLHSTGQAYKGGPNSGVFLHITCDDAKDVPVPGQSYTFGIVKAAQAGGDLEVLLARHRRALRVHLGADVPAALDRLHAVMTEACQ